MSYDNLKYETHRLRPNTYRLMYFSPLVEDKLSQEEYEKFFTRWVEKGYPVVDLGGGVFEISVDELVPLAGEITKLKLGKPLTEKLTKVINDVADRATTW